MIRMLRYLGRIGGKKEMERLVEQDSGVARVHDGVRSFYRSSGNLALYMLRARAETDHRNEMKYAEERAWARGEARGRAEGIASTAQRMLDRGVSPDQIADFTGLSLDEVEVLRRSFSGSLVRGGK